MADPFCLAEGFEIELVFSSVCGEELKVQGYRSPKAFFVRAGFAAGVAFDSVDFIGQPNAGGDAVRLDGGGA